MKFVLLGLLLMTGCSMTPAERRNFNEGIQAFNCGMAGGEWNAQRNYCRKPKKIRCKKDYYGGVTCQEVF